MLLALLLLAGTAAPVDNADPADLDPLVVKATGVGESEAEAAVDALGRLSVELDVWFPRPAGAGTRRLGKAVDVLAFGLEHEGEAAVWIVKLVLLDKPRALIFKLRREGDRDKTGATKFEDLRKNLDLADVLADLETGQIFVDTLCEPGLCISRAAHDTERTAHSTSGKATAAQTKAAASVPVEVAPKGAPEPDWVRLGNGLAYRGHEPVLQGVSSAEPFRDQALRLRTADRFAEEELQGVARYFMRSVCKEAGLPRPSKALIHSPEIAGAPSAHFEQGGILWAVSELKVETVMAAMVASGLPVEKVQAAAQKLVKERVRK